MRDELDRHIRFEDANDIFVGHPSGLHDVGQGKDSSKRGDGDWKRFCRRKQLFYPATVHAERCQDTQRRDWRANESGCSSDRGDRLRKLVGIRGIGVIRSNIHNDAKVRTRAPDAVEAARLTGAEDGLEPDESAKQHDEILERAAMLLAGGVLTLIDQGPCNLQGANVIGQEPAEALAGRVESRRIVEVSRKNQYLIQRHAHRLG
jgi:hypothetical protein